MRLVIVIRLAFCDDELLVFRRAIGICLLLRDTDLLGCFDHPLADACLLAIVIFCLLLRDAGSLG